MYEPPEEQVVAGRVARDAIKLGMELCKSCINGVRLDKEIEVFIQDQGCIPALKGYHPSFALKPYEHTICLGIDQDVVHGVPIKLIGPNHLVTIDLVVSYKNWCADTARTFTYSKDPVKIQFAEMSKVIFDFARDTVVPHLGADLFGKTVEESARLQGYHVVKEYCGHGIGETIHTEPQILNYATSTRVVFQPGRAYAVEPVLAIKPYVLHHHPSDGFSISADCLVSHNEDTIFVGTNGAVNLTSNQS